MDRFRTILVLALAGSGFLSVSAEAVDLRITERSRIELNGTTNIGRWACKGSSIDGNLKAVLGWSEINRIIEAIVADDVDSLSWTAGDFAHPALSFTIPVRSLECGNSAMESDLREALRYPKYEQIRFEYTSVSGMRVTSSTPTFELQVEGFLTLGGERRPIVVDTSVTRTGPRTFEAKGRVRLRMTTFEVTPPVALFGLIRADDQLQVNFVLELRE